MITYVSNEPGLQFCADKIDISEIPRENYYIRKWIKIFFKIKESPTTKHLCMRERVTESSGLQVGDDKMKYPWLMEVIKRELI